MIDEPLRGRISERLSLLYGPDRSPGLLAAIEELAAARAPQIAPRRSGWDQTDAMLITYADSLAGEGLPLSSLRAFLREEAGGLFTFLHLLPFYPYSSDDGFAVEDFRAVREDLGDWEDVAALAADFRLVFDAVINHVSSSSQYMRGYSAGDPRFDDFFISLPPDADTSSVLRTRDLPLLHEYETCRGTERLWTTFSRDQLDLNYGNPRVLLEVLDVLLFYVARGASVLRLDAIPYLWKRLGTSCAHLPETHEVIKLIRDVLDAAGPHALLLTETNVPHRENVSYFGNRGDEAQMIYNFSLPPLLLWSLLRGDASRLSEWAAGLEHFGPRATYLNITATHDGIGMRPSEDLLGESERAEMVRLARERGGHVTGRRNPDGSVSPYELNINYFDALNDARADEPVDLQVARFMTSQAVPLALAGIPGIYVHSLLGSRGDREAVGRTGRARSVNRARLDVGEVRAALRDESSLRARVFRACRRLVSVRREAPAFHPDAPQEILDLRPRVFALRRTAAGGQIVAALYNVSAEPQSLDLRGTLEREHHIDLVTGGVLRRGELGRVPLAPYQFRWLTPARETGR